MKTDLIKQYVNILNQQYENDYEDGWDNDVNEQTLYILNKIQDLQYEIKNGVKGSLTGCYTKDELKEYLKKLGEELATCADFI